LTLYSAYSNDFGNPKSPERRWYLLMVD
jgi:hypothetical protein